MSSHRVKSIDIWEFALDGQRARRMGLFGNSGGLGTPACLGIRADAGTRGIWEFALGVAPTRRLALARALTGARTRVFEP